ncbi:MAG: reverse transcriptase domain-containing protein [Syntrophobacteraceae bacterium]
MWTDRALGIPTIYDRVCRQALLNRLEPIFETVFDDANFGYRKGRSAKDALGKVWKEVKNGSEWIVDADLRDFFGSVDHEKLTSLVRQQIADGRVLRLVGKMLTAGCYSEGRLFPNDETGLWMLRPVIDIYAASLVVSSGWASVRMTVSAMHQNENHAVQSKDSGIQVVLSACYLSMSAFSI